MGSLLRAAVEPGCVFKARVLLAGPPHLGPAPAAAGRDQPCEVPRVLRGRMGVR